jgi:hypothetical protein
MPRRAAVIALIVALQTSCDSGHRKSAAILSEFHSVAQEMALDGFQFDKPQLAWPFDSGAKTKSAYIEILAQNNRLSPEAAKRIAEISIANLSDSDPGETALASLPAPGGGVVVICKDGSLQTFDDFSRSTSFAPPPPREPAWLP